MPTTSTVALFILLSVLGVAFARLVLAPNMREQVIDEETVWVDEPVQWEGRTEYGLDGKPVPPPVQWTGRNLCDSSGNCYEPADII
jgi:hypothetical protein